MQENSWQDKNAEHLEILLCCTVLSSIMDGWTEEIEIFSDYYDETASNECEFGGKRRYATEKVITPGVDNLLERNDASCTKKVKESESSGGETAFWSIEDDTFFYPLGIRNHSIADGKKSVIITWSECSVINFVIKKEVSKKQTKTTRVRLNVEEEELIKDVEILEFNTLLLLESGNVNYFSSAKSMHSLPWLSGVRCIGRTSHGFCIIRLTSEHRLLLEVYEDAVNMGKKAVGSFKQQFDVTFDEVNLFNCDFEDEKYIIMAISIEADAIEFMELLTGNSCSLKDHSEIFIFTVSGNVFVLVPDAAHDDEAYHIEMIFNYSSNVVLIKIDQQRKFCVIFLECGSVDIYYMSSLTKWLLHKQHHTGSFFGSFTYSDNRASLFFTDESQVVELNFFYTAITDRFCVRETIKAIPGIIVCTWIESIEQLVCLDCNNIFHQLSFEEGALSADDQDKNSLKNDHAKSSKSEGGYEKFNTLFELTPARVSELIEKANIIQQLKNLPKEIYDAIEKEYVKQELLAIDDNRNYYSKQLKAHLNFSQQSISGFDGDSLLLCGAKRNMHSENSFIHIHIQLDVGCIDIFRHSIWQLHVNCGNWAVHVFSLPSPLLQPKIQIVLPLERHNHELIPKVQLFLYTYISHSTDHIALMLPIHITNADDAYKDLFIRPSKTAEGIYSIRNLNDLLAQFKKQAIKTDCFVLQHFISLPNSFNFDEVISLFKSLSKTQSSDNVLSHDIGFLNSNVSMIWDCSNRILQLRSNDAAALYYFKSYILLACGEKEPFKCLLSTRDSQQMLVRHRCSLENRTTRLSLEELRQLYEKIRKCLKK